MSADPTGPDPLGRLDDPDYPALTMSQAAELLGVQAAVLRSHDASGLGSHESPRELVREKLKEKRQRSPRTQQIPKIKQDKPRQARSAETHPTTPES